MNGKSWHEPEFTDQFEDWWDTLSEEQQEALVERVELLEREGPLLRRPTVGEITASAFDPRMKELICEVGEVSLRVLFIFDPRRVPILLLGGDKAGVWNDWYRTAIPEADRLYREHLDALDEEGLLP